MTKYAGQTRQQLLSRVNDAISRDPDIQAVRSAGRPLTRQDLATAAVKAFNAMGIPSSEWSRFINDTDYNTRDGRLDEKGWWGRHRALGTGLIVGGAAGVGALAAPAIAGPASSVPTSSGALAGSQALGMQGLAAVPSTLAPAGAGGGLSAGGILSTANRLSGPLSALSSGRQYGRERELNAQQQQQRLDMEAPLYRARAAVRGDELANVQDFQWGPPTWMGPIPIPTSTGGRRPSILSPETRALGRQMSQDALNQQQNPPGMPRRSRMDSILDNAAMYTSLLGSFYHPRVA